MAEAFICDFVRTPIGRYAGALKDVRTDDLAAHPIRVLKERNARVDWDALDDCYMGCANQAGEDNRNVARMARAARGPADHGSRRHRQPAVRLGPRCGRHRGARDPHRGGRSDARRRGGEHDPRAFRDGQGHRSLLPPGRDLRHHDRLALRQRADEDACTARIRCRKPARTWPRRSRSAAPTRTHSPSAASSAPTPPSKAASSPGRSSRSPSRAARAIRWSTQDEHPRGDTTLEMLSEAEDAVPHAGHGHRRQRLRRERRRRCADPGVGGRGAAPRPDPARPRRGHGDRRGGAAHHGHRPRAGGAQAAGTHRAAAWPIST